ncbi:helix-turn-helix transcriptional regulator [Roseospira goensis]|uniref:Transcriptional regulator with XRE-family HTH domain n=1 Tax=Roseospira goensis TaxID=391922 RepID=A0A7W6WJZ5_9PROT|nr:transcriptional regulator with XRE-family HTH domain [Roseospira goensis]
MARGEGPDPVDVHVGERIRLRRAVLRLTQQDLARSIGISFQQLQKYERGANRVSASRLFDIASHLDVPISFFFQDIDEDMLRSRGLPGHHTEIDPGLTSEALRLMAVFNRLPNDTVRQKILEFLTAAATPAAKGDDEQRGDGALN